MHSGTSKENILKEMKDLKNTATKVLCVPSTLFYPRRVNNMPNHKVLRSLLDPGGGTTLIRRESLPKGASPVNLPEPRSMVTAAGIFHIKQKVYLSDIYLPEFNRTHKIVGIEAYIYDAPSQYDIIAGQDFLSLAKIDIKYSSNSVDWLGQTIDMKAHSYHFGTDDNSDVYLNEDEEDLFSHLYSYAQEITASKSTASSPHEVVENQKHLNPEEKGKLLSLLQRFETLFDGRLGRYVKKKFHIDVKEGATPVHAKPYPVAKAHEDVFLKELQHLVAIGVLRKCDVSEWASPSFLIAKKDKQARWISDLWALNAVIKRRVYPLPVIHQVLQKRKGYKYLTKLDLTKFYYTLELDEESKDLCTIVTPHGKYQYCRMPMGLACAPDFAQSVIEQVLDGLNVEAYIDDIAIFSDTYEEHMKLLAEVCDRLQKHGLKINPAKCEWAVQETDFLGYWLTPTGIKPWKKKIDAVLKLSAPTNQSQVRSFLGAVTYYRTMWP